jgi:hypothetical protein
LIGTSSVALVNATLCFHGKINLMSFLAKLQIDDQEFNILRCEYTFIKVTDLKGKPTARAKGGTIVLTVESSGSYDFLDWAVATTQTKSGKITFYRRDSISKMKELVFTDAYCILFKERFTSTGQHPMEIDLELSAKELKSGDIIYENAWSL